MGLTWAIVWAPIAVLIGMVVDPDESMDEMWFLIGAYPGFLGGVVFSAVLGIAEGRRRFDELSLPRVGAWGALAGLLLGLLPLSLLAEGAQYGVWLLAAAVVGPITLLSAGSAAGTLALARMGEDRELLDAGAEAAEVGLSESEAKELLRGGG